MANTKSAKKQVRQNDKRRLRNRAIRSSTRSAVKKARVEMAEGNLEAAIEATRAAISTLDRAATKGAIHKNNASRRKSRLMKHLASLEAQKSK